MADPTSDRDPDRAGRERDHLLPDQGAGGLIRGYGMTAFLNGAVRPNVKSHCLRILPSLTWNTASRVPLSVALVYRVSVVAKSPLTLTGATLSTWKRFAAVTGTNPAIAVAPAVTWPSSLTSTAPLV